MSTRKIQRQLIVSLVSILALFLLYAAFIYEINPSASSYSYDLNILDCNNISHMQGCRHEIGHKMDDDLGLPSMSEEFGHAVQLYILVGLADGRNPDRLAVTLLTFPGIFQYDSSHPKMVQREIYAAIYAWFDGDVSKMPKIFWSFYSTDPSYLELYSCLAKPGQFNICDGLNFSLLKGEKQ